jgi:hypothetical protein
MDDEVILCIGSNRVLMTPEEAFRICEVVNGSSQISGSWSSKGGKNGTGGSLDVITPPSNNSFIAYVVPMTGHMRIQLDTNQKFVEEEAK